MESILARIEAAKDQPLLVVGGGDAFCAGLNLKEVASLDSEKMAAFVLLVERTMVALFDHPAPTVACVNGHAIAGGCILTLCCDCRVCTETPSVRIGVNELALGLVFSPKTLRIVKHRVPPRRLHEVVLRSRLAAMTRGGWGWSTSSPRKSRRRDPGVPTSGLRACAPSPRSAFVSSPRYRPTRALPRSARCEKV